MLHFGVSLNRILSRNHTFTTQILQFIRRNTSRSSPKMSVLDSIKDVDIDPQGVFKYILIKVHADLTPPQSKIIVRGYKRCPYHADIMEEVERSELEPRNLDGECLGGGRINHDDSNKKILVYGYSQGYGKADHSIAVNLLKQVYKNYEINWSDEGY